MMDEEFGAVDGMRIGKEKQRHFVLKCYVTRPGIEARSPRWEADV
jgi:hypothetical protein